MRAGHLTVIPFLADPEAIADELNPLNISHIARNISFKIIGREKSIAMQEWRPQHYGRT